MANLNKELNSLFKRYMARKEEEECKPHNYRSESYYTNLFHSDKNKTYHGTILFYEWSDIGRIPVRYYSIPLFEKFLVESDISLEPYQREIIRNLDTSFISCKPNSKELIVRGSYNGLKEAMYRNGSDSKLLLPGSPGYNPMALTLPVPCGHGRPPMYGSQCGPEQWLG